MRPTKTNPGWLIRQNFNRLQRVRALADFYARFYIKYPGAANDFFDQHPGWREEYQKEGYFMPPVDRFWPPNFPPIQ